ncbi:ATP-binding protein [Roseixanthobacter liquoris]|uniref:ATP-binding protein n=1 Tax=Roseixanthobacter liquoris TaxID=3119921 RepID=UPI003729EF1A
MKSLRARVTALLVAAILLVVVLATAISLLVIGRPRPPRDVSISASQLALVLRMAESGALPAGGFGAIGEETPDGMVDPAASRMITDALARQGLARAVTVLAPNPGPMPEPGPSPAADGGSGAPQGAAPPGGRDGEEEGRGLIATVRLSDGRWLKFPLQQHMMPPPPSIPYGLLAWLALVALGVTGVVAVAVQRLMRPLALIEQAVSQVGADGAWPHLEETGSTEVRAAARTINTLSNRLKMAMESRMRIVAAAAHDLRTPLTRLRLRAEFLEDEDERERWFADLAELDHIADSAIRLVREEVSGLPDEVVPLDELVKAVVRETVQSGLAAELVEANGVNVRGKPLSLKRAIRNLVVNAATHGRGARVRVWAREGRAILRIEDDGPGIPQHLMAQVFEPFFRTDPARQVTIPGAGLGLAIAHEIILRHGGALALSNRASGGLAQQVDLPALGEPEDSADRDAA